MKIVWRITAVVLFAIFIYGFYWVAKTVSYTIFYKDMVIETIYNNVKSECIIE